ncbi:nucleolar protein 16 isoform X1 [Delphinapterus leucas]|uniref:Nucleolar protein 16 n=1 Tax=Delphinapterus leucas TaxID=9749 RepID=A0A2Y9MSA4_DELLE|nr:nucleolar protein 16 isoform X1 [Delphinapterus leucas]
MLDGRQRRGSNAPTSDMPGTRPNRCGRTWPIWVWLWTPTGQCPFLRERRNWCCCFLNNYEAIAKHRQLALLHKRRCLTSLPHCKVKALEVDVEEGPKELMRKPYVLNDLEAEASLPEKKGNTLSRDLIDYVCYMVENHGEDYKAMARDEKNYYQDTPKQIRNKINVYKRFYPAEWQAFVDSLQKNKMEVE